MMGSLGMFELIIIFLAIIGVPLFLFLFLVKRANTNQNAGPEPAESLSLSDVKEVMADVVAAELKPVSAQLNYLKNKVEQLEPGAQNESGKSSADGEPEVHGASRVHAEPGDS